MNKIPIHPRKRSPGEIAQAKRLADYEAKREAKKPFERRKDWRGSVIHTPPRGSEGELVTWAGDNL